MKKLLSLLCSLGVLLTLLPAAAWAVDLPDGWWPCWSAYQEAVQEGDADRILKTGDEVIRLYSAHPMNDDVANGLYLVYLERLDRLIYENRGDYAAAIDNTNKLKEVCTYLTDNGTDRRDVMIRCENHLRLIQPVTGVYAVSNTQSNSYGSAIAPASGTYYGSINGGAFAESGEAGIVSFYVELERQSAGDFAWLIDSFDDGNHVILVNLNFAYEGATARQIPSGAYDSSLNATLSSLAGLNSPVLLRVGGEMNAWTDKASPADFSAAYNYVGRMASTAAPEVELVWSPNYVGDWGAEPADYYPGDTYVDWVGLSLYYNYDVADPAIYWLEHANGGRFADPVANGEAVIAVAQAHQKPVIATEGGTVTNGSQGASYAARQAAKEFAVLNMVYPQVKAIVYFDRAYGANDYTLTGQVLTAVQSAIAANPTLLGAGESQAGTYVPLEQFNEAVGNSVTLGAAGRTYQNMTLSAAYYLDGAWAASPTDTANTYVLNLDHLTYGKHKLEVKFSDGSGYAETKTYTLNYSSAGTLMCSSGWQTDYAKSAVQEVTVNGKTVALNAYQLTDAKGGGTNYVSIRDVADLLDGTGAQFNVGWDGEAGLISMETGEPYTSRTGGEGVAPFTEPKTYTLLSTPVSVDGAATKMEGIILTDAKGGGYTYFKLRDLGAVAGFEVGWSAEKGISITTDS